MIGAAVLWSTAGFFARSPWFDSWPADMNGFPVRGPNLAIWRALFAMLILLPLVRRPRLRWVHAVPVTMFAFMNVAYLTSLILLSAATAIWLQNTAPLWVVLIGYIALREMPIRRDVPMLILVGIGLVVILVGCLVDANASGLAYGLGSGILYSGVVVSLRHLRNDDPAWILVLSLAATVVLLLPYVIWLGYFPTGKQIGLLALFGAFQLGLPYFLFAQGVKRIPGYEAAGIALLEPLLLPLWVFVAWGGVPGYEPPPMSTWIGGGVILVGLSLSVGLEIAARRKR